MQHFKLKLREAIKKFDILLLVASLPIIPMLIAEFFIGVDPLTLAYFNVYYIFLWIVFTAEFFLKFYLAHERVTYLKENWIDALVVLAPVFRSFKIFHVLRAPILLVSDEVLRFFKTHKLNFLYFLIVLLVIVFVSADLVLFFEIKDVKANITTFEDAVWWGLVTISTLGYGDKYPVTFGGRAVAVFLMTLGFALFSIMIAGAVAFFMKRSGKEGVISSTGYNFVDVSGQLNKIDDVLERLEKLEKKLDDKNKRKNTKNGKSGDNSLSRNSS